MEKARTTNSWGRLDNRERTISPYQDSESLTAGQSQLPFGNGRSYGDSCHNDGGTLIENRHRSQILDFDIQKGVLRAQSGILFSDLLQFLEPTGWFPPVVPGTKFITLAGAIANDIHGKNHGHAGTFGCHVNAFGLVREGEEITCSSTENTSLFQATIAGMGLTGFITWAEIRLLKVPSHHVQETKRSFTSFNEFKELERETESRSEYSVAWVDSLATGKQAGRGILISGIHCNSQRYIHYGVPKMSVPFTPPVPLVSGLPLKLFNKLYYHRGTARSTPGIVEPDPFFFPLDAIGNWNRLYGPGGLFQHQSALPLNTADDAIAALVRASQLAQQGSFLTVLKRFGNVPSPGLLSFPMPGYTLTLDFPNKGEKTLRLLQQLDEITLQAGGRINPYKDGRMSAQTFQCAFPQWRDLEALRDPSMMSNFWRRVTASVKSSAPPLYSQPDTVNQVSKPSLHGVEIDSRAPVGKTPPVSSARTQNT